MRAVSRFATILVLTALAAAGAVAQTSGPRSPADSGLTLRDVVRQTLATNPDLLYAGAAVNASRGALVAAAGLFDAQVQTSVTGARSNSPLATGASSEPFIWLSTQQTSYDVALQKQLRSGIIVAPTIDVSRSSVAPGSLPTAQSTTHLKVLLPLWKDRGGAVSAAGETVAEHSLDGATLTEYFTASQSVANAVSAYWTYRAAQQRLDVFRESEMRAGRMVVETRVLVDAEERTTTDLKQLEANLGAKRVARINAEQALTEAWQQLALAMGVSRDRITTPPAAATDFPQLPADTLTANTIAGWERTALAQRADVAAAVAGLRAAEAARRASRADLKPRLDVVVDLGYSGLAQGAGVQRLVAPLYRDVPGLNSSVQLSYQLPVMNAGAQGRLAQANASYQQRELVVREAERRIASDVAVAAAALQHGRLALIESRGTVELWATSVQSEQRKFRLGASTIFDIIQAQDAHTNARLGEIASANGYAVALTRLRFATGTLLHRDATGPTATWTDLLVAP